MNLTIQKIADELGVSKTTVHRALSGTKQQVLELARKFDYTPNSVAQSLRSKKTKTIGLILRGMMVGHYYSEILAGIEEIAVKSDYMIIIACSGDSKQTECNIIRNFCRRRIDGIIIAPVENSDPQNYLLLRQNGIPFVFIDKYVKGIDADIVTADSKTGVKKAVEYMLSHGRQRIAFLNGYEQHSVTIQERIAGYTEQLASYNNPYQMIIESKLFGKEDTLCGYTAMRHTLQRLAPSEYMDGLICVNDSLAFGALKAIREFGLVVPQDIAIIGNNNDQMTEYVFPQLTTISQPKSEMGRAAMSLLLKRIEVDNSDEYGFYSFPVSLLIRDST